MNHHIARCTIVLAILIGLASPAHAQRRPITDKDLFAFVWVADPQISPDGSQVAFVRVTVDEKKDAYDTAIWLAKRTAASRRARSPAGPGTPARAGRPTAAGWRSSVPSRRTAGRSRRRSTSWQCQGASRGPSPTSRRGAGNPEWAPDGKTIAFSSTARPADLTAAQKPAADKPRETDVRVITEAVYRANGVPGFGYVDRDRPAQIWTVPVPANASEKTTPAAVTTGEFAAANHRWSPDGTRIYFVVRPPARAVLLRRATATCTAVARDGGEPARVASIDGSIGAYALSPDGKRVAFVGTLARQTRALLHPARSVGRRTRLRNAAQPHGDLRFRHQRRHRRRPARPARPASERTGLDPRRTHDPRRRRRAGQRQPQARRRGDREDRQRHHGQPRRHVVHRRRRGAEARHHPLHAHGARRSARARRRRTGGAEAADDVQRRAVRAARP